MAYDLFHFRVGEDSFSQGKVELFADLLSMAGRADQNDIVELLDRLAHNVNWASRQTNDELQSSVDFAFFLPLFQDSALTKVFRKQMPNLVTDNMQILGEVVNALAS